MQKGNKKKNTSRINPLKYSAEFEEFFNAYPRKVHKLKAAESYVKFIKMGVEHAKIVDGARRYAIYIRYSAIEDRFTKHPASWLNSGCWDDEYPIGTAGQCSNGKRSYSDSLKTAAQSALAVINEKENLQ